MSDKMGKELAKEIAMEYLKQQEILEKEQISKFKRDHGYVEFPYDGLIRVIVATHDLEDRWEFIWTLTSVEPNSVVDASLGHVSIEKTTGRVISYR